MEDCKEHIKKMRPKLSDSTLKTYCNILRNLYKDVFDGDFDYKHYLKDYEKVMKHLEKTKYNVRKTILSALVVISEGTVSQSHYRKQMLEDAQQYNALQKQNIMTDEQKKNWITWKEVEYHLDLLKKKYYYIFK